MRVVELRRHSVRNPADVHLSREGIALARRIAPSLGRFDRVVASPKPRAVETVEALGMTLDATVPDLAIMPDDVGLAVDVMAPHSFADYVRFARRNRAAAEYARRQSTRAREELESIREGGRLLMISHAGIVEFAAAAARPRDALSFGPSAGPLEGVRLVMDRGTWVRGAVLRVPT